ncbi:MAG: S8 family serine peptidase [Chitinophagales bacterium]|nr:S8 family serine peptidase [Chitinophagales bacterium]
MACGRSVGRLCVFIIGILFSNFLAAQDTVVAQWNIAIQPQKFVVRMDIDTSLLRRKTLPAKLLSINEVTEPGSLQSSHKLFIDDQVLVGFRIAPSRSEVERFADKYNLELLHDASKSNRSVSIFRSKNFTVSDNSLTVASTIVQQEKNLVRFAHPNRVNLFEPQSSDDTYIDLAWHIANSGQQVSCASIQGEHHADAHISGAWDLGVTGQGIRVGVIDFYGFDYNHPDMQGQMLPGWDCINNAEYNSSNFYFTDASQAHGMAVCGVIAGKANNGIGSAGVAYDSKVIPFLIDGSESAVILAMQKAMSEGFDVDVVNCSFGSYFPSPAIEAEIQNMVTNGRVRNGSAKGIVVIASQGNDHYSDVDHPQYPAAYEEVISVSASTPDDRKKTPGDSWETSTSWGTNYGALLDIAAPGVCIFTTDISGSNGYSPSDYVAFQKTSAASPIVAGTAALVLSKNLNLSWQEVKTRLQNSADKTGGSYNYNYDSNKPGHSIEMGYGRVNAEQAVSDTPVGIAKAIAGETNSRFNITPFATNMLDIHYVLDAAYPSYQMEIFDITGKSLLQMNLPAGSGYLNLSVEDLTPGMYFLRCMSGAVLVSKEKFIKVR